MPEFKGRYYEPFLGAGNAFFRLNPPLATLSDINSELINAYEVLRDQVDLLLDSLGSMVGGVSEYERLRGSAPRDALGRAVRFVYLNRTCWNGLYRVNRNDEFNVPYGWGSRPLTFNTEVMREASRVLSHIQLSACDFELALSSAERGDFAFVDPPYAMKRHGNGFLAYDKRTFSWEDQVRLRESLSALDGRGVKFLLTEPDISSIRKLYHGYQVKSTVRTSTIAADSSLRGPQRELLIRNYRSGS